MAMSVEQQVLGFQISVNNPLGMQIIQRKSYLGSVEFCDGIREALIVGEYIRSTSATLPSGSSKYLMD